MRTIKHAVQVNPALLSGDCAEICEFRLPRMPFRMLAAALATALFSWPALADFSTPFFVSDPGIVGAPRVAVGPNGEALFVWQVSDGFNYKIVGRARSTHGNLGSLITFSQEGGPSAENPEVAIGPDGNAVVVWRSADGSVQARRHSAGGHLGRIKVVDSGNAGQAKVAVNGSSDAVLVWLAIEESKGRIKTRTLSADSKLSKTQSLSSKSANSGQPAVAANADGDAVFVWHEEQGFDNFIRARRLSSAGAFGSVVKVASGVAPAVAIDGGGDAVFLWSDAVGDIEARAFSAAGSLGRIQTVSAPDQSQPPTLRGRGVAMDRVGDAVFVWNELDGDHIRTKTRTLSARGNLGKTQFLSSAGNDTNDARLTVFDPGDSVFVWTIDEGGHIHIQARTLSAAGILGPVQGVYAGDISAFEPQLAHGGKGRAVAVLFIDDGSKVNRRIQASVGP